MKNDELKQLEDVDLEIDVAADDVDLFADDLEDRYNSGVVSSVSSISSAATGGTSSASCACTASCFCTTAAR